MHDKPVDDHCLPSPRFPVTFVFIGATVIALPFTRPCFFFELEENFAAGLPKRVRPQQSRQPRVALRLFAVNLFGVIQRQGILHESRRLHCRLLKAFQQISFWCPLQCHQGFLPGLIELLEIVVEQLDIERVVLSPEHR